MENENLDPYKIFFPLGFLSATAGILMWVGFEAGVISFFPRAVHAGLMFYGFMWSFIVGFLMTAVPKMTRTMVANSAEVFVAALLIFLQWVLGVRNMSHVSGVLFGFQVLAMVAFVARRFFVSRRLPFEGFVFMPFAFLWGMIVPFGSHLLPNIVSDANVVLAAQALVFNLVCGIGSRLVPFIMRIDLSESPLDGGSNRKLYEFLSFALVLNASFVVESLGYVMVANLLRASILGLYFYRHFHMVELGVKYSDVGMALRVSLFLTLLGYATAGFFPQIRLAAQHIVFIGGFSLVTLMVATRVTLAHGGASLDLELRNPAIRWVLASFTASLILRTLAFSSLPAGLIYSAGAMFLVALAIWLKAFTKYLF